MGEIPVSVRKVTSAEYRWRVLLQTCVTHVFTEAERPIRAGLALSCQLKLEGLQSSAAYLRVHPPAGYWRARASFLIGGNTPLSTAEGVKSHGCRMRTLLKYLEDALNQSMHHSESHSMSVVFERKLFPYLYRTHTLTNCNVFGENSVKSLLQSHPQPGSASALQETRHFTLSHKSTSWIIAVWFMIFGCLFL